LAVSVRHLGLEVLPRMLVVRSFAAADSSGDVFTRQLQAKTEQELKELLERSNRPVSEAEAEAARQEAKVAKQEQDTGEFGGPRGPEPTRYGALQYYMAPADVCETFVTDST